MIPKEYLLSLIERAFAEDLGDGDHSTLSCIDKNSRGKARLLVKQDGIIAGVEVAREICAYVSKDLEIDIFINDGSQIKKGDIVFEISGFQHDILKAERTILNFMQRMSGIATTTAEYVKLVEGTGTRILDTRKTTPGLRLVEKEAVRIGGGTNHRIGLYDMIMLKDNHIDFAGGIENAVAKARKYLSDTNRKLKIEVETRNLDDVREVL
ncbi:MAG: carboxylating nicotinate-nucleotide diphosphorylase, partial [Bacteroidales bacterium]|nr:carboxylating nicotinate-nucleotide diphosphorylase [Bacteroidales bacterium]